MKHSFLAALILGCLCATTSLFSIPNAAFAIDHGGLGGRPAHPTADSRTQSWFIYKQDPGTSLNDEVLIVNNSSVKKVINLYPADSVSASGGGFALKQEGEKMQDIGSWTSLSQGEVTLGPNESKLVPFLIQIPTSTTPGEYTGAIIVQEKTAPIKTQDGMTLALRMGVRIYLTVSGDIKKSINLGSLEAKMDQNTVHITLPITNTGNASVDIQSGNVELISMDSQTSISQVPLNGFQILRASPFVFSSKFPLPTTNGTYKLRAYVKYLNEKNEAVELRTESNSITIDGLNKDPSSVTTKTEKSLTGSDELKRLMKISFISIGIAGFAVGGIVGFPLGRRSRHPAQAPKTEPAKRKKKVRRN